MNEVQVPESVRSRELIEAAEVLLERAGKFQVIQSNEEAELAAEYRARVNEQIKQLDAERLDMGAGLRETLLKINTKFNGPIEALKSKLGVVDQAIKGYLANQRALAEAAARAQREQEEQLRRDEARRKAEYDAAIEAARIANLPPPPPPPVIVIDEASSVPVEVWNTDKIGGSYGSKVSTRDVWKYRIVDIKKVPEQFLVPVEDRVNKSALNALARSMKGDAKVKGVEFFCEETLQSRVS